MVVFRDMIVLYKHFLKFVEDPGIRRMYYLNFQRKERFCSVPILIHERAMDIFRSEQAYWICR